MFSGWFAITLFCGLLVMICQAAYTAQDFSSWSEPRLVAFLTARGHTCAGCSEHAEYVQYALQIQHLPELSKEQLDEMKASSMFQPDVNPDMVKSHFQDLRARDIRTITRLSFKTVLVVVSIYATGVSLLHSRHSFGGLMFIVGFACGLIHALWILISDVARSQHIVDIQTTTDKIYPFISPWLPFLARWHLLGMNLGMVNALNVPTLIFIMLFVFLDTTLPFLSVHSASFILIFSFLLVLLCALYRKFITGGIRSIVATSVLFSAFLSFTSMLMVQTIIMPPLLAQYMSIEDLSSLLAIVVIIVNANLAYIRPSWIYNLTDDEIMKRAKELESKKIK